MAARSNQSSDRDVETGPNPTDGTIIVFVAFWYGHLVSYDAMISGN